MSKTELRIRQTPVCRGETMDRDMGALVRAVLKDMQWNRPVEKIAKRQDVSVEVVEHMGDATKASVAKVE